MRTDINGLAFPKDYLDGLDEQEGAMIDEFDAAPAWSAGCLLHASYVCLTFLHICTPPDLHLTAAPSITLPIDLRLYDYRQRHRCDLTCLGAVFRAVHAVRHVAYHYDTWCAQHNSSDMAVFALQAFGPTVIVDEVRAMVQDGQRLGWLEHKCRSGYVSFIATLDWARFRMTSDMALLRQLQDLMSLPAVQGLLALLPPAWPSDSFGLYHEELARLHLGHPHERTTLFSSLTRSCPGCGLFIASPSRRRQQCAGCARGNFLCDYSISPLALSSPRPPPPVHPPVPPPQPHLAPLSHPAPAFVLCAVELLQRASARCDQLVMIAKSRDRSLPASMARSSLPSSSLDPPNPPVDPKRHSLGSEELLKQVQLLDLILNLDQKLERLCGVPSWSQHPHSRRESLSTSGLFSGAKPSDGTRKRSDRLSPLKEEEEEEEKEEERAEEGGMDDALKGEVLI